MAASTFRFHLAVLASISYLATAHAVAQSSAAGVARRAESILNAVKGATHAGVCIVDAKTGENWFAHDDDAPLKPASVQKLLTTSAALLRLGPDFSYETRIYFVNGEVWVVGAGDPALGDERLARQAKQPPDAVLGQWTEAVKLAAGGQRISKIVLDDSIFDDAFRHPTWPSDQYMAWYQAPVGGLNYNDNCLDSRALLSEGKVRIAPRPALPESFISNTMRAGEKHQPIVRRDADSDIFEFKGTLKRGGELEPIAVNRPTVFFGYVLRQAFESAGLGSDIPVVRRVIPAAALNAARPAVVHKTPLRDVVWRANTFSQNMFAECLLKSLEAYGPDGRRSGKPGSFAGGCGLVRETLKKAGVDLAGAQLVDGSGLSHENRVSARQIAALLVAMGKQSVGGIFRESLADAGEDGTMKNRFKDPVFDGRLVAKTGTLQNVHCLAGYYARKDGVTLAFAVLVNGPGGTDLPVRIAKALAE